jgi:hypothetical protein
MGENDLITTGRRDLQKDEKRTNFHQMQKSRY